MRVAGLLIHACPIPTHGGSLHGQTRVVTVGGRPFLWRSRDWILLVVLLGSAALLGRGCSALVAAVANGGSGGYHRR